MKSSKVYKPVIVLGNNPIIRFSFESPINDPYILKRIEILKNEKFKTKTN